jgi:hypothetical protein
MIYTNQGFKDAILKENMRKTNLSERTLLINRIYRKACRDAEEVWEKASDSLNKLFQCSNSFTASELAASAMSAVSADARIQKEKPCNTINFGLAVEAAKIGYKITRDGWNGKGMFVVYQKGYPDGISCNEQTAKAWGIKPGDLFKCEPYLQIKMVNGSHSMWVPSINDVLADDWRILT